ncbi:MAG: hypothetical protein ACFFDH_25405 [Promethearchaeota archaeon]
MVEFCKKCGGLLRPSKENDEKILICNSCGVKLQLQDDIKDSYILTKEIYHPPGEEFKNLENMRNWDK